jgi:hypothetical protein
MMRKKKKKRNALTKMVIKDEMPFVFVDGIGFKKFMKVTSLQHSVLL